MISYQLPSGKTVFLDSCQYLDMIYEDDEDAFRDLIANNYGYDINDPFVGSSIDIGVVDVESDIIVLKAIVLDEIDDLDIDGE